MIYLKSFTFPDEKLENQILSNQMNIYNSEYPFGIFRRMGLEQIEFAPVTIFNGGNGVGKTTALNVIAQSIGAARKSSLSCSKLFFDYADGCEPDFENNDDIEEKKFVSSDDVFDYLLDLRAVNRGINKRKREISQEFFHYKYDLNAADCDSFEERAKAVDSRRMTASQYVRTRLGSNNIRQMSNGESALEFWENEIQQSGIYILDEPENSLSPSSQIKLKKFIEESARFFSCQFIISTHSPFLLSIENARIYDMYETPVRVKNWTELKNVREYYEFFKKHSELFDD